MKQKHKIKDFKQIRENVDFKVYYSYIVVYAFINQFIYICGIFYESPTIREIRPIGKNSSPDVRICRTKPINVKPSPRLVTASPRLTKPPPPTKLGDRHPQQIWSKLTTNFAYWLN